MNLPEFSDFLKQFNGEYGENFANEIASKIANIDPNNTAELYASIASVGVDFSVKLLRKYHEWLSAHLKFDE